jgi:hypothetical protein
MLTLLEESKYNKKVVSVPENPSRYVGPCPDRMDAKGSLRFLYPSYCLPPFSCTVNTFSLIIFFVMFHWPPLHDEHPPHYPHT